MRSLFVLKVVLGPIVALAGYMAFDFWNVNRMAKFGNGDGVSVTEYLGGWVSLAGAVGGPKAPELPTELAAMIPKAPEGWTVRPTQPADIADYVASDAPEKLASYVGAVVAERPGNGVRQLRQTYSNGAKMVIFEVIRYPNFVFTSFGATQIKMEIQWITPEYSGRDFMVVRGMEFVEDVLPDKVALRYFLGDVGDQIWVRVLATKDMTDEDLLPFFQTLHVPAMAADVVDKVAGMGEVPVIVLASVIEGEERAAWEAERAASATEAERERAEKEAEKAAKEQAQAEREAEKAQKAEDKARGVTTDDASGVKVRKGTGDEKKKGKTRAGFGDEGCQVINGRKACGAGGAEA